MNNSRRQIDITSTISLSAVPFECFSVHYIDFFHGISSNQDQIFFPVFIIRFYIG